MIGYHLLQTQNHFHQIPDPFKISIITRSQIYQSTSESAAAWSCVVGAPSATLDGSGVSESEPKAESSSGMSFGSALFEILPIACDISSVVLSSFVADDDSSNEVEISPCSTTADSSVGVSSGPMITALDTEIRSDIRRVSVNIPAVVPVVIFRCRRVGRSEKDQ